LTGVASLNQCFEHAALRMTDSGNRLDARLVDRSSFGTSRRRPWEGWERGIGRASRTPEQL